MVALLSDADSKTRANAAGALGNMVRNSDHLVDLLVATGTFSQSFMYYWDSLAFLLVWH